MPTSGWRKIGHVMAVLNHVPDPTSVLDVGIGFGKFGYLMRETLDIRKRRYFRDKWEAIIHGVEIWPDYITPVQAYVYNRIFYGDIRKLAVDLPKYDIIILADVIEHMPEQEGAELLRKLFAHNCRRGMVVSYPTVIGSDWKRWTNPSEKHHCIWTPEKLQLLFSSARLEFSTPQVCFILKE